MVGAGEIILIKDGIGWRPFMNLNLKSDSTSKRSPIASLSFWFQGLLSTTYQVEVTFSVKGGPEEQKSIFVKVFLIKVW